MENVLSKRIATQKAIAIAKEAGAVISFDPNLREPLWASLDEAREMLTFANAAASLITTKKGALRVMPEREAVEQLIKTQ